MKTEVKPTEKTAKKKTSVKTTGEKKTPKSVPTEKKSSKTSAPKSVSAEKKIVKASTAPKTVPKEKKNAKPVPVKKKKLRLKKSVKIALVSVIALCAAGTAIAKSISKRLSSAADDKNVIKVEIPPEGAVRETEPPETEPPETEPPTTEADPNTPFIDYDLEIDPEKPMIALTYDDGPAVGSSQEIVDILAEYGAHATFFVVGDNIDDETAPILNKAIDIGCEIGNHTQSHISLTSLDTEDAEQTLKNCDEKVYQYTKRYPQIVRPPYGAYNTAIREADKRMFIYWSLDTSDWKLRNAEKVYNVVMEYIGDGDIVLMHDIHEETAEASQRLIPDLLEMGYQLVTVSELMHYRHLDYEESMVLFNVHPDEPFFDSLYGTVYQKPTEEPEETEELQETEIQETE